MMKNDATCCATFPASITGQLPAAQVTRPPNLNGGLSMLGHLTYSRTEIRTSAPGT